MARCKMWRRKGKCSYRLDAGSVGKIKKYELADVSHFVCEGWFACRRAKNQLAACWRALDMSGTMWNLEGKGGGYIVASG